jgi:hypothetical protein
MTNILKQVNKIWRKWGRRIQRSTDSSQTKPPPKRMAEEPKETAAREMERLALLAEDIAKAK